MLRLATILGTRPEAIKLAPVLHQLARHPERFESRVWVSGQHREMVDQVLSAFEIEPDVDLGMLSGNRNLAEITSGLLTGLHRTIEDDKPDAVLVQGDTTTALCGAMAAYYNKVGIGHVEAGLRTGNNYAPYPEEGNRRLISALADFHFAPTPSAQQALLSENIDPDRVFVTGNTVIDALLWTKERLALQRPQFPPGLVESFGRDLLILVTAHRRESFGDGLTGICQAVRNTADTFSQVRVLFPVHPNPNVYQPVHAILGGHDRIHLMAPQTYSCFVWLMDRVDLILTDSGGIQEEAPCLGTPVLVTRHLTERPEGIEEGSVCLVGVGRDRIEEALARLIRNPGERDSMRASQSPYGDGSAAGRIVGILEERLSSRPDPTTARA